MLAVYIIIYIIWRMDKKLITFNASKSDYDRWRMALASKGLTLTEVATKALNRFAARVEKQREDDEH